MDRNSLTAIAGIFAAAIVVGVVLGFLIWDVWTAGGTR